ncbi:MAG: helix-turn-helix domain-containing protein [Roseibium sp.]
MKNTAHLATPAHACKDSYAIQYSDKASWISKLSRDQRLSSNERIVGIVLCDYFNTRSSLAWPTIETLQNAAGVSKRTVIRATKQLEACGYVSIERARGRGQNNRYRFVHLTDENASKSGAQPSAKLNKKLTERGAERDKTIQKRAKSSASRCHERPPKRVTDDTQTKRINKYIKTTSPPEKSVPTPASGPLKSQPPSKIRAKFILKTDPRWDRLAELKTKRIGKPPVVFLLGGEAGASFLIEDLDAISETAK